MRRRIVVSSLAPGASRECVGRRRSPPRSRQSAHFLERAATQVLRLDQLKLLSGPFGLCRRDLVGRHQADLEAAADIAQMRIGTRHGLFENPHSGGRGHERPVGANDFEAKIGPCHLDVRGRGPARFGGAARARRVRPAV